MLSKIFKILIFFLVFCVGFLVVFAVASLFFEKPNPNFVPKLGVSFSPGYAKYLKLDWKKTYLQVLDELKVKNLRLPSYWDALEKEQGKYNFADTDFMLSEAEKRGVRVLLVVGARQPRWPECHYPDWAEKLTITQRQQMTLQLVQSVVERYKDLHSIWAYQVENEPFAGWFGENCDRPDAEFLKQEVDLVKTLDPAKPIVITDSGEWGFWADAITNADILGSSVYRKAYNSNLHMYMSYPIPASLYRTKASLVTKLPSGKNKKVIVTELQAEAWLSNTDPQGNTPEKQSQLFSVKEFQDNMEFVKKIGFEEDYLWGVEWWYFMAEAGFPEYLNYAKTLF